jgi:RpiB/LacA/LacB family sugar-phosphate isomerase
VPRSDLRVNDFLIRAFAGVLPSRIRALGLTRPSSSLSTSIPSLISPARGGRFVVRPPLSLVGRTLAGEADEGIVCCWTGTGASIAANKVPGIRAALVHDAQTARGARLWNHANVLALSLRATPIPVMREILEAWYETPSSEGEAQSEWNLQQIERIRQLEERYRGSAAQRS